VIRERMERQRRRDTAPEVELRRLLHAMGHRFRVGGRPLPDVRRTADLVFGPSRVAVFVDGCFWHGCPQHGTWPKSNAAWWRAKIEANVARDRDTDARLAEGGWTSVRVWEHDEPAVAAQRVSRAIQIARRSSSIT
jgi:DNA mismatch endonuclease (patch repair protein)